jgi:hypothetical protein
MGLNALAAMAYRACLRKIFTVKGLLDQLPKLTGQGRSRVDVRLLPVRIA